MGRAETYLVCFLPFSVLKKSGMGVSWFFGFQGLALGVIAKTSEAYQHRNLKRIFDQVPPHPYFYNLSRIWRCRNDSAMYTVP